MKSFRAKPLGWRNESYRHYLASKGIASKIGGRSPNYLASKGISTKIKYFNNMERIGTAFDSSTPMYAAKKLKYNFVKKRIKDGIYETDYGNAAEVRYDEENDKYIVFDIDMGEMISIELVNTRKKLRDFDE